MKWIVSARYAPWSFDSINVLVLSDGRTETIWGTEKLDATNVMNQRVLAREREILVADLDINEDSTEGMEALKSFIHSSQGV